MTRQITLCILLIVFTSYLAPAQPKFEINLKSSTSVAIGDSLPFWFWANQYGTIEPDNSFLNLSQLSIQNTTNFKNPNKLSLNWGGTAVAGLGKTNYLQINQAFTGFSYKGWQLEAGMFNDAVRYNGLSTTNGNVTRSINARPYPKIRLSTIDYRPIPFIGKWLQFKAEYDEGILNDGGYVKNAHLHHKSIYFSIPFKTGWRANWGLEHFVMWGGVSKDPNYGKLPDNFNAYLLYITGSTGNSEFTVGDQINVAGNQIGDYQFQIIKSCTNYEVEFYISHWFEDNSGMILRNWKDNLIGINLNLKKKNRIISSIVYEFINTKNQSVVDSFHMWNEEKHIWETMEPDFYFTHWVYKSCYTYHKMMIGSPLFKPQISSDGISVLYPSDRFYTHHLGVMGSISDQMEWKGLLTYTHHFGTYPKPYSPTQKECSIFLYLKYHSPKIPFDIEVSTAADFSNASKMNGGIQVAISKAW